MYLFYYRSFHHVKESSHFRLVHIWLTWPFLLGYVVTSCLPCPGPHKIVPFVSFGLASAFWMAASSCQSSFDRNQVCSCIRPKDKGCWRFSTPNSGLWLLQVSPAALDSIRDYVNQRETSSQNLHAGTNGPSISTGRPSTFGATLYRKRTMIHRTDLKSFGLPSAVGKVFVGSVPLLATPCCYRFRLV